MAAAFGRLSEKDGEGPPPPDTASTSIVGRGTELTGDVVGSGQLRVEGRVDGTIRMDGEVQIAAEGTVEGRIEADEVVAAGRVSGTVTARDAVRLEDGCQVDADVHSPVVELQEGGLLNGRVEMSEPSVPEETSAARDLPSPAPTEPSPEAEDEPAGEGEADAAGETGEPEEAAEGARQD